jgi:apolipoprotein N-acyltransferase
MAVVAGALMAASFPPYRIPLLLPFGFALFLHAIDVPSAKTAARLAFVCGLTYFGATIFWLGNLFGAAAISLIAIAANFPLLFGWSFTLAKTRIRGTAVWFIAPMLWTGIEYFRSEPFPLNFGWMGFGYAVVGSSLACKLASIAGCYGVTFVIAALGTAIYRAVVSRNYLLLGGATSLWVAALLMPQPSVVIERPLKVRLVQANSEDDESHFRYSESTQPFIPDVILWPEYSFVSDPTLNGKLWAKLADVAKRNNVLFIFGAKETINPNDDATFHNTAFVMNQNGVVIGKHYKNHPVHFIRDGVPGTSANAFPTDQGRIGVGICFDMDYPDVARRLAQDGAEVFLIPNDDPPEWGDVQRSQHSLLFSMRAAENGKWLARADVAGGTSAVAPDGREVAHIASKAPGKVDVVIGRNKARTLYSLGGWMFGPLCLAGSILLACGTIGKAILNRKQS